MNWPQLEQNLAAPPVRATPAAAGEAELREFFGEAEYSRLRELAAHAQRTRQRAAPQGNIVFIPGIMGSDLAVEEDGSPRKVWVALGRLILGAMGKLQLAEDGASPVVPQCRVLPIGLEKRTYSRAVLWLRARWNVETLPFDWRKDLDDAASRLASLVQEKFKGQPAHIVAHSMGGLVARNFIRLYPDLWQGMRDRSGAGGGRLVMLGTPNYGSYTIPQVFTGKEWLLRCLAMADLEHNLDEVLEIVATFVGCYQMLPSPARISASQQALYRPGTWGDWPVSARHLARAFAFHYDLERGAGPDPERMVYVAGCNQQTLAAVEVLGPGDFRYTTTYLGDGRVTHALGLLRGVATYFVEEVHGNLPRNETVLTAAEELLQTGRTSLLGTCPPALRAVAPEGALWRQSPLARQAEGRVRALAEKTSQQRASLAEEREVETTITAGLLAGPVPAEQQGAPPQPSRVASRRAFELAVEVECSDVAQVKAPVVVVGHYAGVEPTQAEGALDRALGRLIKEADRLGMIGGRLGELFFIPVSVARQQERGPGAPALPAADTVLLAGMGSPGAFGSDELRCLVANLTLAVLGLGLKSLATVLIGSGNGGLPPARAVRGLLQGVRDGLSRWPEDQVASLREVRIVELDPARARAIQQALKQAQAGLEGLELHVREHKFPPGRLPPTGGLGPMAEETATRITVEREGDLFRYSALTANAVVPVRELTIQSSLAEGTAQRLKQAATLADQERYGRLLYSYLLPEDFQRLFGGEGAVTLVLDRATAAFPWEMACFGAPGGTRWLGTDLRLTRQFRTLLSSAAGVERPFSRKLRALVIADPAPEPELRLAGARREGRQVVEVLTEIQSAARSYQPPLELEIEERIGAEECDPIEILALLLSGEFDLVHYAGHGFFDDKQPDRGGWVFGREVVLSAREIFRARRVPRLVVANACFSGVVRPGQPFTPQEAQKALAGLAEAFFERGVQNFIGAGWPVGDEAAVEFARTFYREALRADPAPLREATRAARKAIQGLGPTWGAYQHYGSGTTGLVPGARQ
jgi:pimeloyl-ACP methyl ester carboxylesterase